MIGTFGNGITDPRKCGLIWRSIADGSKSRGAGEVSEGGRSLGCKPCDDAFSRRPRLRTFLRGLRSD